MNARDISVLLSMLVSESADERLRAAQELASVRDMSAVPELLRRLQNDPDLRVRLAAVYALWLIGDTAAVEPLTEALLDPHEPADLRADCAHALGQMGDYGGLGGYRATVLAGLLSLVEDEHVEVRYEVVYALGMLRDPVALPALEQVLRTDAGIHQRFGPVREAAKTSLQWIREARSQPL